MYVKVSEKAGATWLENLPPQGLDFYCQTMRSRVHVFDLHTATLLVNLIVRNAYVQCGTNIYRQVNGIPMGASCSPNICDMYLLSYEYSFFERLTELWQVQNHRHTATRVLRAFAFYRRYLDDCFTITQDPECCRALMSNTQVVQGRDGSVVSGIYPTGFLPLNNTSLPDTHIGQFMDVEVRYSPLGGGLVDTRVYSKRSNNYFQGRLNLITVPSAHSNLSYGSMLGVVTGQLIRFHYLTMTVDPWLQATLEFCHRFRAAGHLERALLRRISTLLPRLSTNFGVTANALAARSRHCYFREFPPPRRLGM
jgi:hypothetical protein